MTIDATSKLIPSFLVGKRDAVNTNAFVSDVAARLKNRVQISTDGLRMYVEAIDAAFGANVDYAQVVKTYEADAIGPGRYSPPKVASTEKTPISGEPISEYVSTSYVERSNLNIRMGKRRFTRLTNGFSKKFEWVGPRRAAGSYRGACGADPGAGSGRVVSETRVRMGRPPKAPGDAKASTFSVRLRADERAMIEAAAERAGVKASEWARRVLLDAVSEKS